MTLVIFFTTYTETQGGGFIRGANRNMAKNRIFAEISSLESPEELFDFSCDYFQGQGFGSVCYVAPQAATGPFTLLERAMPAEWIGRYRTEEFHRHDPIPTYAFKRAGAVSLDDAVANLPPLNADEQAFMEAFRTSGISNGLLVPTYGPYGRPGLIGLTEVAHPSLLKEVDVSLVSAVAQQIHIRMEVLQNSKPGPGLSPKEREVLKWLVKGKSVADVATITGTKPPTIATHIQRIYAKMGVHDRINCVAKALALHYI